MCDLPDGSLRHITSSGFSEHDNTIIIRVPKEMKKPNESTFQFATLDPSKSDDEWPGDEYARKLIPKLLEKAKIHEKSKVQKHESEINETKKETRPSVQPNLSKAPARSRRRKGRFGQQSWRRKKPSVDIDPWIDKEKMLQWQNKLWMNSAMIQTVNNVPIFNTKPDDNFLVAPQKKGLLGDHPADSTFQNNYVPHTDNTMLRNHPSTSNFDEFYPPTAMNSSLNYRYNSNPKFKRRYSINTTPRNSYSGNKPWMKNKLWNSSSKGFIVRQGRNRKRKQRGMKTESSFG